MTVERRLFQAAAVWFMAGLGTGLWLLGLYTGRQQARFDEVRTLHVALLVVGWLGMTVASALLTVVRRRRGHLWSERLAAAATILWNVWCAGSVLVFFLPLPALRTALGLALPLAVGALLLACWGGAGGWTAGVCSAVAIAFLTLKGLHASLPGIAPLEIAAVLASAAIARYQWKMPWGWLAVVWALGIAVHSPWELAAAAGVPLVAVAWRAVPRSTGSVFLAMALAVDWLTASVPALTPLGVAASLSSVAFGAVYLAQPRVVTPRIARWHTGCHVAGFAALVAGLQFGATAAAWAGALAVVAGAGAFMAEVASPSRTHGAASPQPQ